MLIYYVICTYVSPPRESTIEEAVYPPQRGDVESPAEPEVLGEKGLEAKVVEV